MLWTENSRKWKLRKARLPNPFGKRHSNKNTTKCWNGSTKLWSKILIIPNALNDRTKYWKNDDANARDGMRGIDDCIDPYLAVTTKPRRRKRNE